MLGYWRTHREYQIRLKSRLISLMPEHEAEIRFYRSLVEKVYCLDLDPLKNVIISLYSPIGRPAQNQPELFRALVTMLHTKIQDPTKLVAKLRASPVLAAICGFEDQTPGVGTFYDLLARLWLLDAPQKAIKAPKAKGRKGRKRPRPG